MTPETIGHYRITALIGSGGMGEVYRARDTKLGRDVAIKVLPPAFNSDANRMARFEREARVLASLNHPNIAHIYGVEERALVMELVEGESPKGPMPFEDAWKIALQIADALEYAHDKGVVHRDLKPANVKVTPEGVVKLLDFGLAKAFSNQPDTASGDPEVSPTVTLGATVAGTIMGTAAYMSPEQARGKPVDKRADIWSWGVVLYELFTGERMFQGEDAADTLAAVIHKQPDLEKAPPQVRTLLRRCLEKDPKKRLRDISVAKELIEEKPQAAAPSRSPLPWIAAGALLATSAALGWIAWRATRPAVHELTRLEVDLGPNISLVAPTPVGGTVVLSPDGRRLVYSVNISGGQTRLFTRRLDQLNATELPGTEGAVDAFFSPDSQWIGFYSAGKVRKISVEGGAAVPLADVNIYGGADWGEDGSIVVSEPAGGRGLLRIPSEGGSETVLVARGSGEAALVLPQFLPGGKALLFTSAKSGFATEVFTFADHRRKVVAQGGASARYIPASSHAGYLVFTDKGTLFAIPFDLDKLETYRSRTPILNDIAYTKVPEGGQFTYSPSGTLVYRKGAGTGQELATIQWLDPAGHKQPLLAKPGTYVQPRFSPNGEQIAFSELTGRTSDISVYDPKHDRSTRLTFGEGIYTRPVWTPDGRFIVFSSASKGLWWTRSDGSGQPQPLFPSQDILFPSSFTKDGKQLAYAQLNGGKARIWTVPVEEDGRGLKAGKPEPFLEDERARFDPVFLPNDRLLAFAQERAGSFAFYVRPFPSGSGQGAQWQISNGGGSVTDRLAWSNDHELYYQSGDQIMVTSYTVRGDAFIAETPHVWISKTGGTDWDLAPDGKRIAVVTPVGSTEVPGPDHTVVFLQNFVDYLKQKIPLNK